MSWYPKDKEIVSVLLLSGSERYSYLIKKLADEEKLWSLWQEGGWALAADPEGREAVPIWPHSRYAEACARGGWERYQARLIALDEWMERWIPGMTKDRRLVAAFPTPNDKGVFLEPNRIARDIEVAMESYE